MAYFEKAGWEADWIATARRIVRTEFDRTYADCTGEDGDKPNETEDTPIDVRLL